MIYDTYYGQCGFADEIIKMSKNPANKAKKFRPSVSYFFVLATMVLSFCFVDFVSGHNFLLLKSSC